MFKSLPDGSPFPRITTIVTSCKDDSLEVIEESIKSIEQQNYPDLEVILISSADFASALAPTPLNVTVLSMVEDDYSHVDAFLTGLRHASGGYVHWLPLGFTLATNSYHAAALESMRVQTDIIAGSYLVEKKEKRYLNLFPDGSLVPDQHASNKIIGPELLFSREKLINIIDSLDREHFIPVLLANFAESGSTISSIGSDIVRCNDIPDYVQYGKETPTHHSEKLNVLFINDSGFRYGAGIAHQSLVRALTMAGHAVITLSLSEGRHNTVTNEFVDTLRALVGQFKPDLIVVGNMHQSFNRTDVLHELSSKIPTLFVMHDQWLMTGLCTYVSYCELYASGGCQSTCPKKHEFPSFNKEYVETEYFNKRSLIFNNDKFSVATDSNWLTSWTRSTLQKDVFFNFSEEIVDRKVKTIKYSIDLETFKPRDKAACREELDLPADKFIVMTTACNISEKRKGLEYLVSAVNKISSDDILVVAVGYKVDQLPGGNFIYSKFEKSREVLAKYFAAADVFVGPSLEEAFGQVFIEAAASGTPAIGFKAGGVPDAVFEGVTGALVETYSSDGLADAIRYYMDNRKALERISFLAPLHIRNMHDPISSCKSLIRALEDSGLAEHLPTSLSCTADKNFPDELPVWDIRKRNISFKDLNGMFPDGSHMYEDGSDDFQGWKGDPVAQRVFHEKEVLVLATAPTDVVLEAIGEIGQNVTVVAKSGRFSDQMDSIKKVIEFSADFLSIRLLFEDDFKSAISDKSFDAVMVVMNNNDFESYIRTFHFADNLGVEHIWARTPIGGFYYITS